MRHGSVILALVFALFASGRLRAEDDVVGGIAAIVDAGAPIAVAGIQADADKAIASINADAAVRMTQITADTTKYLANDQKDVALYQAQTAMQINNENQKAVTDRLALQLSELANARHEAEAAEQMKLQVEQQYNNQRIALAKQEAANEVMIAKEQLTMQVSIAANSGQGFGYGSRLTLTNSGLGGAVAAVATPTPNPQQSGAERDPSAGAASNNTAVAAGPRGTAPKTITMSSPKPRAVGPRSSKLPARLLASVGGGSNRGVRSSASAAHLASPLARGSFQPPARTLASQPAAERSSRFAGIPHASRENRASTTVYTGDSDGESDSSEVASARHAARDSAAD